MLLLLKEFYLTGSILSFNYFYGLYVETRRTGMKIEIIQEGNKRLSYSYHHPQVSKAKKIMVYW